MTDVSLDGNNDTADRVIYGLVWVAWPRCHDSYDGKGERARYHSNGSNIFGLLRVKLNLICSHAVIQFTWRTVGAAFDD